MRGQYKNKRDANEPQIVATIRAHGISVCLMDQPADALCGYAGQTFLVEFKNGPKAPLCAAQERFLETWRGDWTRINSVQDAEAWAKIVRGSPISHAGDNEKTCDSCCKESSK